MLTKYLALLLGLNFSDAVPVLEKSENYKNFASPILNNEQKVSFSAVGDWGGVGKPPYNVPWNLRVGRSMNRMAGKHGTDMILLLGDNFYYDGVRSVDDPRFNQTYHKTFDDKQRNLKNTPMFAQTGNHDYHRNVSAQILYTQVDDRWTFPDYFYQIDHPALKDNSIEIYMIDTMNLRNEKSKDLDDQKFVDELKAKQLAWLEESLAKSTADFVIVAGHHPVVSVAEHGSTSQLVDELKPILEKYQVNFYLCGHDHNLQLLTYKKSKNGNDLYDPIQPQYIVTGMATLPNPSRKHRDDLPDDIELTFFYANPSLKSHGGYTYYQVVDNKINAYFLDAKNEDIVFSTSSGKRKL